MNHRMKESNIDFRCVAASTLSEKPSHAQFFTRYWIITLLPKFSSLSCPIYWTVSRIFFNDALEHNEWCGRMLASLTSHVFARGHVLPYYVIRSLGSLMVACLVTTLPIRSAWFSRRLSFGEGLFLRSLRSLMMKLERFRGWLTFVENFGDWFFSISRNRYLIVRNSRTLNVTQICVSSEGMNEWFEEWAQRWWAVAQHESLSSNI